MQGQFQAIYIYGVVEPKTGEHFFYEFTHLNSQCFQIFLELVSEYFADSILIIQLDNGRFHKAKNRLFGLCYAMDGGYKGWNTYIERHLAIFVNYFRSRAN